MYVPDEKSTAISYRCINQNLPRFCTNILVFNKIKDIFSDEQLNTLSYNLLAGDYQVSDFFCIDFFNFILPQTGIDTYNSILGGYVDASGNKVQGLNELINLYNQKTKAKLPELKPLYKQVLSDRTSVSFYEKGYQSDQEVFDALRDMFAPSGEMVSALNRVSALFNDLDKFDLSGIYVKNGVALTNLSQDAFETWNKFQEAWNRSYEEANPKNKKTNETKYEEKRKTAYKKIASFSLKTIEELCDAPDSIKKCIIKKVSDLVNTYYIASDNAKTICNVKYPENKKLQNDAETVEVIKNLLDSVKAVEYFLKGLTADGKEDYRDEAFYSELDKITDAIMQIDYLYNAVRNYVTKKPFSKEKFKLWFQNPQFLGGWDRNKESAYRSTILTYEDQSVDNPRARIKYYIAIMDKSSSKCLQSIGKASNGENYGRMYYKLISEASKSLPHAFFSKKGMKTFAPSSEVRRVYSSGTFKKEKTFSIEDCRLLIDYYKDCLKKYPWGKEFDFCFSDTNSYSDISGFYKEVEDQGYKISFDYISKEKVDALVNKGKLYLFQIYSKDFSEYSHGTENLHTMYFRMLFDPRNKGVIRLSGKAELFMRKASIPVKITHPANEPMNNKNPKNPNKTSTFAYDLIKDRRYTKDQYEIHMPICINKKFKKSVMLNQEIRRELREDENPYVIGIDRGERNLLYVVVVDGKGRIVEQASLNEIINSGSGYTISTDYHELLDTKEKERLAARQNWKTIENIKELKEGYISQTVHKICELVLKYNAVIALEDLNSGFKNSRIKVEKQVYQKFEKMLIDKLNYLVDKSKDPEDITGILKGLQLTNPFQGSKKMGTQNGIMFYIPAWLTSKLDPTTGFVNLFRLNFSKKEETRAFIKAFDSIRYNKQENYFEFSFDYSNFKNCDVDYVKKWTVCTYKNRIKTFRNPEKNNEWDDEEISLTDAFIKLFEKYSIDYTKDDLREDLCGCDKKEFYVEFVNLFSLTVQMRNSKTGTKTDYMISPVKNKAGEFYYSDIAPKYMPENADANGAYNIARKVLWAIDQFKKASDEEYPKTKIAISNKEWLQYAQTHSVLLDD